jgi:hypothetical protein
VTGVVGVCWSGPKVGRSLEGCYSRSRGETVEGLSCLSRDPIGFSGAYGSMCVVGRFVVRRTRGGGMGWWWLRRGKVTRCNARVHPEYDAMSSSIPQRLATVHETVLRVFSIIPLFSLIYLLFPPRHSAKNGFGRSNEESGQ